jgi:hypothetical protein
MAYHPAKWNRFLLWLAHTLQPLPAQGSGLVYHDETT